MSVQSSGPQAGQLVEAMRIALERGGAPLETAGNVLATACVTAATLHPEWAMAFASQVGPDIRALAEAVVTSSAIEVRSAPA